MKWDMFAGGTFAAEGKHGYQSQTPYGTYDVQPISNQWGRHKGYVLYFLNTKGALPGGLWQQIGDLWRSPNQAKGKAREHYERNFEVVWQGPKRNPDYIVQSRMKPQRTIGYTHKWHDGAKFPSRAEADTNAALGRRNAGRYYEFRVIQVKARS